MLYTTLFLIVPRHIICIYFPEKQRKKRKETRINTSPYTMSVVYSPNLDSINDFLNINMLTENISYTYLNAVIVYKPDLQLKGWEHNKLIARNVFLNVPHFLLIFCKSMDYLAVLITMTAWLFYSFCKLKIIRNIHSDYVTSDQHIHWPVLEYHLRPT